MPMLLTIESICGLTRCLFSGPCEPELAGKANVPLSFLLGLASTMVLLSTVPQYGKEGEVLDVSKQKCPLSCQVMHVTSCYGRLCNVLHAVGSLPCMIQFNGTIFRSADAEGWRRLFQYANSTPVVLQTTQKLT